MRPTSPPLGIAVLGAIISASYSTGIAAAAVLGFGASAILRHLPARDAAVYDGTPPGVRLSSVAMDQDGLGS